MNFERISLLLKSIRFVYIGALVIIVNLILFILVVAPQKEKISRLQTNFSDQRNAIRDQQKENQVLQQRLAALQKAEKDLKVIYTQILSDKKVGVPEIRQELEDFAGSLSVNRSDVAYRYDLLPDYGLRHFTLTVPVEGSYGDIRRFINAIERSQHFLILDRVNLSSDSKPGDNLKLGFELSTYLRDEDIKHETRRASARP
jgi:Tfp pilus assembly protein PilO